MLSEILYAWGLTGVAQIGLGFLETFRDRTAEDVAREGYRPYTTAFDSVVSSEKQLDKVIGPLGETGRQTLDEIWRTVPSTLAACAARLRERAVDAERRIGGILSNGSEREVVVSLLLDQSGSMRGEPMLLAATTLDIVQDLLVDMNITVEILGFTTAQWRGGRSRRRWSGRTAPTNPGRLNDLLHIVYRSAVPGQTSWKSSPFRSMLRPDLPKENIDGEALLWAASRLRNRPERRKLLVVISDGAPVDDSTLLENGPHCLDDHLRLVVHSIEQSGEIELGAVGIGDSVDQYYSNCSAAAAPEQLGEVLISLLADMIAEPAKVCATSG